MKKKLRYCIEYVNPRFPILDNGRINIRHLRVETEKEADRAIILIVSFGGRILSTYRGSVTEGRVSEWDAHLELEDKFSQEWLDEILAHKTDCYADLDLYKPGKHQLAIKFMNYLDENRPEGKMCLSNGECEDIDNAFEENDWAKIIRYVEKYCPQPVEKTSYDTQKCTPSPSVSIEDVARVQFASHAKLLDKKRKAVFDWEQFKEVVSIFYGFGKKED